MSLTGKLQLTTVNKRKSVHQHGQGELIEPETIEMQ